MSTCHAQSVKENPIVSGPILPVTIKLTIPVLIGHLLNLLYTAVDTLFISMLDRDSTAIISGIGLVLPVYMLVIAFGTGLFAGISSLLARSIGKQHLGETGRTISSGMFLAISLAVFYLVTSVISGDDLIHLLAGDQISQEAVNYGKQYFNFLLPGMFLLLLFFALAGIAQGAGLVKYFAMAMMLSTLCNILLDPLLIFGFQLGVKGAALASSISIALSVVFLYSRLRQERSMLIHKIRLSLVCKRHLGEILGIAVPQILGLAVISMGVMSLNYIVGSISETNMNAWVLVSRMDEFVLIFGYAIGNATLTQVGQNFGSNDFQRVTSIYNTNILFTLTVGIGIVFLYNLAAYPLFSLFTTVNTVVQESVFQVRVISFTFLGVLVLLVSNAMFQATGKAIPGLILHVIRMVFFIIPLSYLAVIHLKSGIVSLFIIVGAVNILTLVIAHVWSKKYLKQLVTRNSEKTDDGIFKVI
ncbi:MATE family efflux transporter [bacterium]|nr:MATE family efflux transporter [bacterium]